MDSSASDPPFVPEAAQDADCLALERWWNGTHVYPIDGSATARDLRILVQVTPAQASYSPRALLCSCYQCSLPRANQGAGSRPSCPNSLRSTRCRPRAISNENNWNHNRFPSLSPRSRERKRIGVLSFFSAFFRVEARALLALFLLLRQEVVFRLLVCEPLFQES